MVDCFGAERDCEFLVFFCSNDVIDERHRGVWGFWVRIFQTSLVGLLGGHVLNWCEHVLLS